MPDSDKHLSKFMSLVLRHAPEKAGLTLDSGGWASVEALIGGADFDVTAEDVARVVRNSDKQRFSLSEDGARIRANQGHSIPVDLGLTPVAPPAHLFHGTAEKNLSSILETGLRPQSRTHVHLSPDTETARKVGMRHGKPVILLVAAGAMAADGGVFFRSVNGVWLTDRVQPHYLSVSPAA